MKGSSNVKSYILEKIEAELLGQVMCKVLHIMTMYDNVWQEEMPISTALFLTFGKDMATDRLLVVPKF